MATVSLASGSATAGFGSNGMLITPSAVRVATSENYVDSITATSGDLHKRDVDEKFIKRYGNQGITGLLELLGAKKETNQTNFEHYEEAFIHNSFRLRAAIGTITAAQSLGLTVHASDDAASGRTYVRVNDIVMFKNGDLGLVTQTHNETGFGSGVTTDVDDGVADATAGKFVVIPYNGWTLTSVAAGD